MARGARGAFAGRCGIGRLLRRRFASSCCQRRSVKKNLHGHGMGRHSQAEVERLAARDLEAISEFLGDKPWLMGNEPCGADASVWSEVASCLSRTFETPIRDKAESLPNLVAYRNRGMQRWFPEMVAKM